MVYIKTTQSRSQKGILNIAPVSMFLLAGQKFTPKFERPLLRGCSWLMRFCQYLQQTTLFSQINRTENDIINLCQY